VVRGENNAKTDSKETNQKFKTVRFGLVTIKNFGQGISTSIIEERKRGGKFKSLTDFLDRVKDKNLNKKSLEALIKSGAMDTFGIDRGILMGNMELLLQYNKEQEHKHGDQDSLFGLFEDKSKVPGLTLAEYPNADMKDRLAWEKELLGLYISGHPLEKYRDVITKKDIDIKKALETKKDKDTVILGIIINEVRTIQTKNNETMAFVTISDFSGSSEAVVFPRVYKEFRELIQPDQCLAIKATVNTRNGEKGFILERMKGL
jgi:DNA polymerase-3 subunit alpha